MLVRGNSRSMQWKQLVFFLILEMLPAFLYVRNEQRMTELGSEGMIAKNRYPYLRIFLKKVPIS